MEIEKTTLVALCFTIATTITFVLTSRTAKMRPDPERYRRKECECDSIKSLLIETDIDRTRYEIIMDRLWEKDTAIYNEVVGNLE